MAPLIWPHLLQHRAVRILLLSAVYFITAKLGLLLAIAPGYATAVWPPSGIALGTMLLWPELWPAVWLGSFCTNLSIAFDPVANGSIVRSIGLAAAIGVGAVLQAQAGRILARRFGGASLQLTNEREVFRFLFLAGPLACLVNASWSVLVLVSTGEIPAQGFAFTWGTWWIGDTIGVLIFAPLTFMWLSREEQWQTRRWVVTVPLGIIFAVALLVFVYTTRSEAREARQTFERDAALVTASLQRRVDLGTEILHALASFFTSSQRFNEDEFARFTTTLLARHGELQEVFWAPWSAPEQTFPTRYLAGQSDASVFIGFDLASEPALRTAIESARDSGEDVSVPAVRLPGGNHSAYVVLVPLYDTTLSPSPSVTDRRSHLLGFTGGTFDIERLAAAILAENPSAPQLSWRLEDHGDGRHVELHRMVGATSAQVPATTALLGSDVRRTIQVADREWVFTFEPTLEYIANRSHLVAWLVLSGGLLFTALVGAGALIVTGRTMTIRAQVQARTEELAQINEKLAEEVCDHIRTEETLDREREFLQVVLDNLSEGIATVSADSHVTMANRAAYQIWARLLGTADALDAAWDVPVDTFCADGRTPLERHELPRARALRGETVRDFEFVLRYQERPPVKLRVTSQPLLNADKRQRGAILMLRDITDVQKVEQLKREFVATVSHELRTPLTSIRGSLGLLTSGKMGNMPAKVQHLIEMASRNTERLTFLINDLLDMEKIEQGAMKFEMSEQSLDTLVQQAIDAQQGAAQSRNVSLRVRGNTSSQRVHVDPERLLQVLANLLSNAIKFSPPQREVLVQLRHDERHCHVAIQDHGPGIESEFRDRIFQKFSQADSSDARTKGGTGLGLAISKALIERMGGKIGYDSEPGCGATFFLQLPLAAVELPENSA
ncbi:MAG: ATP-binding protein [Steroidobacteraceae bacterium]